MSSQSPPRVAVVGGGVIGASSAYHLARSGARVCLVTEGAPASGASGRSLSWINSAGIRSEHYHRFRMIGIDRYRTLLAGQPTVDWLRFDGGLRWQATDKAQTLHQVHVHEVAYGYDSQLLTPDEVAVRIPGIDAAALPAFGAIWNPGEGWVDLPSLINYLTAGLIELGGEVITDAGIAFVKASGGRVRAIATERYGDINVDAALLATGSNVPHMVAGFGVTIPETTTTALLIKTQPVESRLRVVVNAPRVSLRRTTDGAFAVDADWATPHIEVRPDGTYGVPTETIAELLAEASHVLTDRPSLRVETYGIGPKPVPGDGEPVLGPLGDVRGLYVAFTHSGATLAMIIGELLAYEITTGEPHPLLAPFRPERFSARAL